MWAFFPQVIIIKLFKQFIIENYSPIHHSECNSEHWTQNQTKTQFDCVDSADASLNFKYQDIPKTQVYCIKFPQFSLISLTW